MNPLLFVFLQARKTEKHDNPNEIPEGFITLERFGELFHQKLDACYARLQGNSER